METAEEPRQRVFRGRATRPAAAGARRPRSLYEILQVSPLADEAVLQAAYRTLARANHPDLNRDPSAPERMRELNEAYDTLSDRRRRAVYDLSLNQNSVLEDLSENEKHSVRRRTSCWRCSDPLAGAFARYCSQCHWIICEVCHGCGCQHPSWKATRSDSRTRLALLSGWLTAALLALAWLIAWLLNLPASFPA